MEKPQISIRIAPSLLKDLNDYVAQTGKSKTEIVVEALSDYLGGNDPIALSERLSRLEKGMGEILATVRNLQGEGVKCK